MITLQEALNQFSKALTSRGKSINTIVAYKGDINQLIKFLNEKEKVETLEGISVEHIENFKKDLTDNGYTAKSISRKLNSIKNFFSYLKIEGKCEIDPSTEVKHPKYENEAPKILKAVEYRSL